MISSLLRSAACAVAAVLVPGGLAAAPTISGVSGTVAHGGAVTIVGSGFGAKSPAKPQIWASFEAGSTDADPDLSANGFGRQSYQLDTTSQYSSRSRYNVSNMAKTDGAKTAAEMRVYISSGRFFAFAHRKFPATIFANTSNFKMFWAWPNLTGCTSNPNAFINLVFDYMNNRMNYSYQGGSGVTTDSVHPIDDGSWVTWEIQEKKGTADNYDGNLKWWENAILKTNKDVLNVTTEYPTDTYCTILFQDFWTETVAGLSYLDNAKDYLDDVYMDDTWARVMIGDASTFDGCTHREPLIPTAWSATSITAYLNQGAFANGASVYVFVVDANGEASPGAPITISGTAVDGLPPYTDGHSPARGATGVARSNRTVSFHVKDDRSGDEGVDVATIAVTIEGMAQTCGTGLACAGGGGDVAVTYTHGLDWSFGQVVDVSVGASDVAGNAMAADAYSFTVASDPAAGLEISTAILPNGTVGTAYAQALAAAGGVPPYGWSLASGSLPAGLSLSVAGEISGTPTAEGTASFTVEVQDSDTPAGAATRALSIVVGPGTATTVTVTDVQDTYVNAASSKSDLNFSTEADLRVYQYPASTVANRILQRIDLAAVPANASIESARLRLYLTGAEIGGGDDPMQVWVYRVGGAVPDIATVTWSSFAGALELFESVAAVGLTPGWVEWDVTQATRWARANGSALYLALDGGGAGVGDTNRIFASADHVTSGLRPQLVVSWTPAQLGDGGAGDAAGNDGGGPGPAGDAGGAGSGVGQGCGCSTQAATAVWPAGVAVLFASKRRRRAARM